MSSFHFFNDFYFFGEAIPFGDVLIYIIKLKIQIFPTAHPRRAIVRKHQVNEKTNKHNIVPYNHRRRSDPLGTRRHNSHLKRTASLTLAVRNSLFCCFFILPLRPQRKFTPPRSTSLRSSARFGVSLTLNHYINSALATLDRTLRLRSARALLPACQGQDKSPEPDPTSHPLPKGIASRRAVADRSVTPLVAR